MSEEIKQREITDKRYENVIPFKWLPGQTGNPNGRPAVKSILTIIKEPKLINA